MTTAPTTISMITSKTTSITTSNNKAPTAPSATTQAKKIQQSTLPTRQVFSFNIISFFHEKNGLPCTKTR